MRDPQFVFAFLFSVPIIQLFAWSIARHASDIRWSSACILALITCLSARLLVAMGFGGTNTAAIYLGSALFVWMASEFFYELDIKHKILIAAICPLIGFGAYVVAGVFEQKFFTV